MSSLNPFKAMSDAKALVAALDHSLAVIEFDPNGTILRANANFCSLMGYSESEIVNQHHGIFIEADHRGSAEYREFWEKLRRGEADVREYKRIGKLGKEVWIQASYNPVRNRSGKVVKVVKVASDVSAAKQLNAENAGKLAAISRVQAVIEFSIDGKILSANENFCSVLGYQLAEIVGQHHRMFVEPTFASSSQYAEFWLKLQRGEFISEEFERIGKGNKRVWISASYNPIFDLNGKVCKVVKFATDVTDRVSAVSQIGSGLSQMAQGNLLQILDRPFIPSLDQLRVDFNASVSKLRDTMAGVSASVRTMVSGSTEISDASDELSRRTEQQAANLEETAAALEQITSTVASTADGTRSARRSFELVKADADASALVVEQAVHAMGAIQKSSGQINQIIGVIDEIAFQTNLLALNAGVEAARAGDAGRGFAVVASEVRALAQRSAEAAKEIKSLISESSSHVSQGVTLVGATGDALRKIMEQIGSVATIVSEIASSAEEQATGLKEVNTAVSQMDQITQQNAAMVEESTAASKALNDEASRLGDAIRNFKIDADDRERHVQVVAPRSPADKIPRPSVQMIARRSNLAQKINANPNAWEDF